MVASCCLRMWLPTGFGVTRTAFASWSLAHAPTHAPTTLLVNPAAFAAWTSKPDELRGMEPYERIHAAAKEALEAMFDPTLRPRE